MKPGGILYIRVPHFSNMGAFTDITHKRPFGYFSFNCFDINDYHHYYTEAHFSIIKKEIKYLGLYPNDGIYEKYIHNNECVFFVRPFVRALNSLIRLSPMLFDDAPNLTERLCCRYESPGIHRSNRPSRRIDH